jgi:hypothetical protein
MMAVSEVFRQEFCSVVPCTAGGRIIAGQRVRNCVVQVKDGELVLGQVPGILVAQAPVAQVQIVTPPTLRKIGTAVVVRLDDGELLAVEFDGVYRRQQQRGKPRGFLREVFSLDTLTTIGKSTRLGRQLSRAFAAALVMAGAMDKSGATMRG